MTIVSTNLNTVNRGNYTTINGRVYYSNGFDPIQVLTPNTSYQAGITGPTVFPASTGPSSAAGSATPGSHLLRFRFRDAITGYVSNPSPAFNAIVQTATGGSLTMVIGAAGDIVPSADTKATLIDLEMTPINDGTFYRAASVLATATTVTVGLTDAALTQLTDCDAQYGSATTFDLFSHEIPKNQPVICAHRGRLFVGGDYPFSATLTVNSGSVAFASTITTMPQGWPGRLIVASADTTSYAIATVNSVGTAGTLTAVYGGTTGTKPSVVYVPLPNRIYYSRPGAPEEYFAAYYARDVLIGRGDKVRAMYSRPDALYIFGQACCDRLAFAGDPGAASSYLMPVLGLRGTFNQKTLVEADGQLFSWDRNGIYACGPWPQHLSFKADDFLKENVDYSQSAQFFGGYDPIDHVLMWFFVALGDTFPRYAICKELHTDKWFTMKFLQGITSCATMIGSDGQVRLWLGDINGYIWAFSTAGTFDGVPPAQTALCTVIAVGSTTTVINVNESLDTASGNAGVTAYFPATGDTKIVSSNTTSALTISSALGAVPGNNAQIWLGSIPFEYRTKWYEREGKQVKKKPTYFYVSLYPGTAGGVFQIYFYKDYSATPFSFSLTAQDQTQLPDGVTLVSGVLTVSLTGGSVGADGFVAIPMPSDYARAWQAKVVSQIPVGALRIMDMGFRLWYEQSDAVESADE